MAKCEACGVPEASRHVNTTNGGLFLCQQCLDDINRKNPEVAELKAERERMLKEAEKDKLLRQEKMDALLARLEGEDIDD